ncbi:MAG: DUF2207 domain-containing protein [Clostridiales bacterium]|nr:DUF2207 domain-containing protein [Clostridiales bacterium]
MIKKRKIVQFVLLFSLIVISLAWPFSIIVADDRSYNISHYGVEIHLQANGDAHIKEEITYDFYGDFNGVLRDIDIDRTDGIEGLKVSVGEAQGLREFRQSEGQDENVYELDKDDNLIQLKVYEQSSNEEKTFIYEYILLNVAEKYSDIGVFNRKVIDSNWDVHLEDISITITIPQGANKEELKVFAHGPLTGVSQIVDDQTFRFEVPEVMPGTFVETLVIFPPQLIPNSNRVYEEEKLAQILDNEKRLADQANAERERAREELRRQEEEEQERLRREAELKSKRDKFRPAFIALILAGFYSLIRFISRYSREIEPQFQGDYYRDLPGDYTPAIMTYLLTKGNIDSKDIMATIMDLVRKKKITIKKIEREKGLIFKKTQDQYQISKVEGAELGDLYPHESFLISWFLGKLGDSEGLVLDDLKHSLKRSSQALEFHKDYRKFQNLVKESGESLGFFTKNDLKGSGIYALIALGLLAAGLVSAILLKSGLGILIAGIGFIILISMLIVSSIRKLTRYGVEQTAMWRAFKRFLLHFSNMDKAEIPSIAIWEHYLVYAISLGVAKEVIDQLPKVFSHAEFNDPSLTYMGGYRSLGNLMLINSMISNTTSSIDRAISTAQIAASPSSSASGMGGGFSGGSSGGGGGGGGGGAF